MDKIIQIHGNKWYLAEIRDNILWAKNQKWNLTKYSKSNDHDHCLICYWTIFETDDPECGEAYFFGGSTWLCKECYGKFVEKNTTFQP
ncbi:MAG: hypothetical protein PVH87_11380 [Desulfobacteraceae bacterium]|jgi:hypothetical protein